MLCILFERFFEYPFFTTNLINRAVKSQVLKLFKLELMMTCYYFTNSTANSVLCHKVFRI
jgi:hypothetical protein